MKALAREEEFGHRHCGCGDQSQPPVWFPSTSGSVRFPLTPDRQSHFNLGCVAPIASLARDECGYDNDSSSRCLMLRQFGQTRVNSW
jgi:hypothetical protein